MQAKKGRKKTQKQGVRSFGKCRGVREIEHL
jgi:hypothetical protein